MPSKTPLDRLRWIELFPALLLVLVLLIQFLPILRSDLSWEDESLHAATSLAMLHGSLTPTVLADFPGTHSLVEFYGPVGFWLGAASFKLFGFSRASWRVFVFAGNLLLYFGAYRLFRMAKFRRLMALSALVILSLSLEESFGATTMGRPDVWPLGAVLVAMLLALRASERQAGVACALYWVGAGALGGIFLGCTPRIWTLWLSFSLVLAAVACSRAARRNALLSGLFYLNGSAFLTLWLVLLPLHSNPIRFLHTVQAGSRGDKINASPLLGGEWGIGQTKTQLVVYTLILLILLLGGLRREIRRSVPHQALWFVSASLLNGLFQILLLSRALSTSFYWGPLLLLSGVGVVLCCLRGEGARSPLRYPIVGTAGLLLLLLAVLRVARTERTYRNLQRDDSSEIRQMLSAHVLNSAVVYGPYGLYFFAVDQAGADYRYATEQTTPGLASIRGVISTQSSFPDARRRPDSYVLWPTDGKSLASRMPQNLENALGPEIARVSVPSPPPSAWMHLVEHLPGAASPDLPNGAVLYRLEPSLPDSVR